MLLMLKSNDVVMTWVYNCAKPQQDCVGYSGSQWNQVGLYDQQTSPPFPNTFRSLDLKVLICYARNTDYPRE